MPLQQQPFAKGLGVPVSEVMQYTDSTPLAVRTVDLGLSIGVVYIIY